MDVKSHRTSPKLSMACSRSVVSGRVAQIRRTRCSCSSLGTILQLWMKFLGCGPLLLDARELIRGSL